VGGDSVMYSGRGGGVLFGKEWAQCFEYGIKMWVRHSNFRVVISVRVDIRGLWLLRG